MHTFGRTTNNRLLSECFPENEVWINADAARALPGFEVKPLKTGDKVVLMNQDGVKSNLVRVKITERIRGDSVYMVHGYGHTAEGMHFAKGRGASDSELVTRYKTDPIMGGIVSATAPTATSRCGHGRFRCRAKAARLMPQRHTAGSSSHGDRRVSKQIHT